MAEEDQLKLEQIMAHLDSGKFLVLSPSVYNLCPEELRNHPNVIKSNKLPEK